MPKKMQWAAAAVFGQLAREIKIYSMGLLRLDLQEPMQGDIKSQQEVLELKSKYSNAIFYIFQFLMARIRECPLFVHIIDRALNKIMIDPKKMLKDDKHVNCSARIFLPADHEDEAEFKEVFNSHTDRDKLCSCSTLDICLQSNTRLSHSAKVLVYDFMFQMFESYHFKETLIISFASNMEYLVSFKELTQYDLCQLGVHLFTSTEFAKLVFENKVLRDSVIECYEKHMLKFTNQFHEKSAQEKQIHFAQLWAILECLEYLARREHILFISRETDWLDRMINSTRWLYLVDIKKPRTEMVEYAQQGRCDESILKTELQIISLLKQWLEDVDDQNKERNKQLMLAFIEVFKEVEERLGGEQALKNVGFHNLPLHRAFAYYFTRLLLNVAFEEEIDGSQWSKLSLQSRFRNLLKQNFDIEALDQNLQQIMFSAVKSISFIHEILSKKWILHGYSLEYFPQIYYGKPAEMSLQDLCLIQILLCCDNLDDEDSNSTNLEELSGESKPLIEYLVDNYGTDDQLKMLFEGLKNRQLIQKDFGAFQAFDDQKLKLQLICFLRFLIQISHCEVSFLKQVYNAHAELKKTSSNSHKFTQMWDKAMQNEAVHLLLLNKKNVGIDTLKKATGPILEQDKLFEAKLFEVSTQSRDIKNQMTFALKDEYYPWLDPFHYIHPENLSAIYKMYDLNGLKDLFLEEGLNDIVGDYLGAYQFVSPMNQQIIDNISRSKSIIQIVTTLLEVWLDNRKQEQSEEAVLQDTGDEPAVRAAPLKAIVSVKQIVQLMKNEIELHRQFLIKQREKEKQKDLEKAAHQIKNEAFDTELVNKFVDTNVAHHCLKLLVTILNAMTRDDVSKLTTSDKQFFAAILEFNEGSLVRGLMRYKKESQDDKKMTKLIDYIFSKMAMVCSGDSPVAKLIKTSSSNTTEHLPTQDSQLKKQNEQKVDKMKKKQNKLLQKMKNKGKKLLQTQTKKTDENTNEQNELACAFCQETLDEQEYMDGPYGQFAYVQTSKLMYQSTKQSYEQLQKQGQSGKSNANEDEMSIEDIMRQELTKQRSKQVEELELIKEAGLTFMNPYSGSGAVITNCRHYSHVKCLNHYLSEQRNDPNTVQSRQIEGFGPNEFSCPICKTIGNCLMPEFQSIFASSDMDFYQSQIQGESMAVLYMQFISAIILQQQGFVTNLQKVNPAENFVKDLQVPAELTLKDIKDKPLLALELTSGYFVHQVNLIDIKGSQPLFAAVPHLSGLSQMANFVFSYALLNIVDESATDGTPTFQDVIGQSIQKLFGSLEQLPFSQYNVDLCIGLMFKASMCSGGSALESIDYIISSFQNILSIQVCLSLLFQSRHGRLVGSRNELQEMLQAEQLVEFQNSVYKDKELLEHHMKMSVQVFRKLVIARYILCKACSSNSSEEVVKSIYQQELGVAEEYKLLFKHLNLDRQASLTDLLIPKEDCTMRTQEEKQVDNLSFLQSFHDSKFITKAYSKYTAKLINDKIDTTIWMPPNLAMLAFDFSFELCEIPLNFKSLQLHFYKKTCHYCNAKIQESVICLLCGVTMCYAKTCGSLQETKAPNEGNLSWHARVHEGGGSIYLSINDGTIIMLQNGAGATFDTPFRSKYGELVSPASTDGEAFNIDEHGGGKGALEGMKKLYMDFQLANAVLQQRKNPDSKYKIYIKNAL